MDFRLRIAGYIGLFVFYAVQVVVISYDLNDEVKQDNPQSFQGLVGVNAMLLVVATVFLILKWLAIPIVDRMVVLFDSFIFALSYCWLAVAAPVADVLKGFFVLNITIAMGIVIVDIYEFRQFSSSYQRIRARSSITAAINNPLQEHHHELSDIESGEPEHRAENPHNESIEDMHKRIVAVRLGANAKEIKYMPHDIDLTKKGVLDGFRVNLSALPEIDETIPRELPWSTFEDIVHTVDSSSCHIYTARWGTTPVILKLIKEDRINSPVALAEFDIEERVLSRVRHPHIVRLLGSGTQPRKYLVLEYLSGGTLSSSLGVQPNQAKQRWLKKFTLLETLKLAHGLAEALNYLHNDWSPAVHIIHRDLKPDNIGWSSEGVLKLFDFGLSVSVRAQRERTEQYRLTGNTGTLRYMAPEVVLGRSYHQSVDTYSFGILIWQVASGQVPFREMGKKTYFDKVVIKGVRPQIDPRWPPAFSELLRNCWHEDKNARPSFADVTLELSQLVQEEESRHQQQANHCVARCASGMLYYVQLLRPLFFVLGLGLLAVAFVLTAAQRNEGGNNIPVGAIVAALSALALYASVLSYLCDAWPLVPLQDTTHKLNFSVDEEGPHLHSPTVNPAAGNKKKKNTEGIELTSATAHTHTKETINTHKQDLEKGSQDNSQDTHNTLFGAARKANKGILPTQPPPLPSSPPPTAPPPPVPTSLPPAVPPGMSTQSPEEEEVGYRTGPRNTKGLLSSLAKVTTRGRGKHKRDDISGAENVTFSPLSSMADV